jgi:type I restriction enzyme R subunit
MTPHGFTEDQLVERPALEVLESLGWEVISAAEEVFGAGGTLGRETPGEAVLLPRLEATLAALNPGLAREALAAAVEVLTRDRSVMSLVAANREMWELLRDGVPVTVHDPEHGGRSEERVRVVDWADSDANDFLAVSQMTLTGALYTRRPDVVGFVNGLPLVVLELKKLGQPIRQGFDGNLTSYKSDIPQLFWANALLIVSNGTDSRVGSLTSDWGRFFEWKRIEREDEPRRISLEVMLRGTCDPTRLLDLVENFTLFSEQGAGLVKVIGQNHQVLGVNNAIAATLRAREQGHGRGGVFWQTQGSGKSLAMVFYAQKILRRVPGNWSFVVVTDRIELDDQIAKTFKAVGAVSEGELAACHAQSGAELQSLLRGNHRYVFTIIHKFQTPEQLSDRPDIIVLTDEAHRSQYDTLALNMRAALPRAMFLAFTGTPLIAGEERTRDLFGDYVSIYDFEQSVEDGATVPLYYENRTPELKLENANLNEDIYSVIENAELDERQEEELARQLGRQYHLITRDDRLESVARDIVRHFLGRGFLGKAMVVSIDKATTLRMHDKVRKHWDAERRRIEKELAKRYPAEAATDEYAELLSQREALETTEMALVVSTGQNEIAEMQKLGLDIVPHRKRMNDEALDEKFKNPADPLRLVFVCAMWLTGFDAPSCSTVYLDKPMRNHTLMQTIARANRVYPGKHSGLIVDYANVFASLEMALAIYGRGRSGTTPVRDKRTLVEALRGALEEASGFCTAHDVKLTAIETAPKGSLERLSLLAEAVNRLITPDRLRKEFLDQERLVGTLYRAVKPDPVAVEFFDRFMVIATVAGEIRRRTEPEKPGNISVVMAAIGKLLDESIAADGYRIREGAGKERPSLINLADIDFEVLAKRFEKSNRKNIELEQLKAAIRAQLGRLVELNSTRVDYLGRFEALIAAYNAGSRNIDDLFRELITLSNALSDEQQRHVREQLTEEELTIFDLLTRPGPDLTTAERDEVKKAARQLLEKVKLAVVLDWRQKSQARARVRLAIEDTLDDGLPRSYTPELFQQKVSVLFEHVYESYQGEGRSVYNRVA